MSINTKDVSPEVADFLERLDNVRSSGKGWVASCPCRNDDDNPSLSVNQGDDGRLLVNCHRGVGACSFGEILKAVDIRKPQLAKQKDYRMLLTATYEYRDAQGELLFQKLRFIDESGKKTFRQRAPKGDGGWEYSLSGVPKVLYNLPAVSQAVQSGGKVYVVEGEKDADTLIALNKVATTSPNGAGSWLDIHTEALKGAAVEIVADNDKPGYEHAWHVHDELVEAGCQVRVWRTPKGKDITDYLALGGDLTEMVRLERTEEAESDPLIEALPQVSQILGDVSREIADRLSEVRRLLATYAPTDQTDEGRLVTWLNLVDETEKDEYDWVIPGLLERQERVIVVAAEGVGKSTLARQVAILSSYGIHPFTMRKIDPIRTLYVDLENPERIVRRNGRPIVAQAARNGHVKSPEAHILIKPAGFDLLKEQDRATLEKHIQDTTPDLLLMGPLYKAFLDSGGRTSEAIAVEVVRYLDYIRDTYKVALWLEHHAPLGSGMATRELRPFGSAVWSRWPEFGLALTPDPTAPEGHVYNVQHFRGEREPRQWPQVMRRGKTFPFEVLEYRNV